MNRSFQLAGMLETRMIHFPHKEHTPSPEYTLTMIRHVENLLRRFMSTQTTTLVWLRVGHSISLQPITPAHVIVDVTGLF